MSSSGVKAWPIPHNVEFFILFNINASFNFQLYKKIYSKPHYSYMIVYMKSHNFVNNINTGGEGGGRSPIIHLNFGSNLQEKPKGTKCQSYMGFMY